MRYQDLPWELTVLDPDPPVGPDKGYYSFAVGDLDGDDMDEWVLGGKGHLVIYKLAPSYHREVIAHGNFGVGLALADIDGDGRLAIITGDRDEQSRGSQRPSALAIFRQKKTTGSWERETIAENVPGHFHDVIAFDIDGDGELEIIACVVSHSETDALMIYDRREKGWHAHTVQSEYCEEGLAVFRATADAWAIASGVHAYRQPEKGPYSGPWIQSLVAPNHREMCRVQAVDITGNGIDDLVIVDSEYLEGCLSWFENCGDGQTWKEHPLLDDVYYGHSLTAQRDDKSGAVTLHLAEMAGGGWEAPYNFDARVLEFVSRDQGTSWEKKTQFRGQGTHEAKWTTPFADGQPYFAGKEFRHSRLTLWRPRKERSILDTYQHTFVDLDFHQKASDVVAVDIDGDGLEDIVAGAYWYHAPSWKRRRIPGISQVLCAWDIDGDGRQEIIVSLPTDPSKPFALASSLAWAKPKDPLAGKWEIHPIGDGIGDWVHGSTVAPVLPGGRPALITAYHSAHARGFKDADPPHFPQIWEIPAQPENPWPVRTLAEVRHGESIVAAQVSSSPHLDLLLGTHWLENLGDGTFKPHHITDHYPARIASADLQGRGRPDVVTGDEILDYPNKVTPWSCLRWYACPEDPTTQPWQERVIDRLRCPHSILAADLDGDGVAEIVAGEHDPFYPYRNRCHLYAYKKADAEGNAWTRFTLDDRFEHHDGCKLIRLKNGRTGILSISWNESYLHLWAPA